MRKTGIAGPLLWQLYLPFAIIGVFFPVWPLPCFAAGILIFAVEPGLLRPAKLSIACILMASGAIYAWGAMQTGLNFSSEAPVWLKEQNVRFCGRIVNVQTLPEHRLRIYIKSIRPETNLDAAPLPGLCAWTWDEPGSGMPLAGQKVCISRNIMAIAGFANGLQDDYALSFYAKKIFWRMWSKGQAGKPVFSGRPFFAEIREKLRQNFIAGLKFDNAGQFAQAKAVLLALIFADKSELNLHTQQLFAAGTIAHSLALSGQHLGIALLFALFITLLASKIRPEIFLLKAKRVLICLVALPLAVFYLWLGNAPPSLIRAAVMLIICSAWLYLGKTFTAFDLLCAVIGLIIIVQPLALYDLGLQLSLLCVAIIILFAPVIAKIKFGCNMFFAKLIQYLAEIACLSFVIQIFLLPVSLTRFQTAGLWFLFNIFWLPLLALWVLPFAFLGLITASCQFINLSHITQIILDFAALPCNFIITILNLLDKNNLLMEPAFLRPHWTIFLAFIAIAIASSWIMGNLAERKKQARNLLFLALAFLAVGPILREINYFDPSITLEALDVGQGQALLLKFPHNGRILIDGGGSNSHRFDPGKTIVAPILKANAAPKVSAIINSHPDLDHLGGLFHILNKFDVPQLFHNGHEGAAAWQPKWLKEQKDHDSHVLYAGDKLIIGDPKLNLQLEVLHPPRVAEKKPWRGNSASLVLRLTHNGKGLALLTGDAEKNTLRYLANSGQNLQADVVIAPHHGSDRSLWANFYKKADPKLVAACCGYLNRWNYPGKKLANFLTLNHIPLIDTGNNGKIKIKFDKNLQIAAEKGSMPALISDTQGKIR